MDYRLDLIGWLGSENYEDFLCIFVDFYIGSFQVTV